MRSLIIFLILYPLTSFSSQDYNVSNTFTYSTTAKKIIQQVNSSDDVFFNFIECDLILESEGQFEGYSKGNCQLLSSQWLYLDEASVNESSRRFNSSLNNKAKGSYGVAFVSTVISAFTASTAYHLSKPNKYLSLNSAVARAFGSIFFAVTSVISGAVAYYNYEPSIESIMSDSDIDFKSIEEIENTSKNAYELIQETLKETLNQMGVSLLM